MQAALARIVGTAVEARQRADGMPFLLAHLVTNRCMCECASCLWKDNESENVPLDDLKRFYAEASELGFAATAVSGGEPFLRKDLGKLTRFIKHEAKLSVVLVNTGWYLKRRMDEVLPNIDMLVLSVDSANAERHDKIRGLPGLFDRIVEGVRQSSDGLVV